MKKLLPTIIVLLFAGFFQLAKAQNISNEGSDFWLPFPTHDPSGNSLANMNVFVTSKTNSEVTVSCGTYTETKPILANTIVTFSVPRPNSYINAAEGNMVLTNRGIHVITTAGKPNVAVYAHIYAGARSAASLILPKEALGQKYYSMNYTQDNGGRNFLVLVAVEDNTDLIIHENGGGVTRTVSLPKAGDVYEYYASAGSDLTGTFVEVDPLTSQCKRFAAFSGSTSLTISCTGSRDPLFQQLYTINSWGKNYGVVPFIGRRYILRVLAQEDNTKVNVNGTTQTLNRGQYLETQQLTEAILVSADKLISVAQYSLTQSCSSIGGTLIIGDPEMVLLNPTEFNIKNITVFSSSNQAIQTKYVNIFMKTAKTSTFRLNGSIPNNGTWQPVPSDLSYSYIQIQVFDESLTLTADDGFNAIAYGFGQAESYAYSAGTSLASTQFLLLVNKTSGEENATACIGQAADFKLTLPYQLTKLVWKFSDGTPDYEDNAPNGVASTVNGETLYTYTAPVNKTFIVAGKTQVKALATIPPSGGSCYPTSEIELIFNFDVDPLPKAAFTKAATGCANEEIAFKDISSSEVTGKILTKWLWDFGDGKTSTDQNPKHIYANGGNYTVKLSVGAENGCLSEVAMQNILINPKVVSLFTTNQNSCIDTDISFVNQSTIDPTGTIVKWTWDMGDGKPAIQGDGTPFNYHYTAPGKYTVTLVTESDKGCISKPFSLEVNITTLPIADFIIPDVCLADAQAVFINSSTDHDGTIPAGLTYLWNFGDASSGILNSSTERDGKHKYNAPGNYTVTLTITNANGCKKTLSLPFTVNGSFPKADFETLNASNLCSNQIFTLKNISTVDFGNITKVQWYIDGVKYGDDDLDPTVNKLYEFTYPQFTTPLTKTLDVKMVVYSGGTCSNEITHQVVLLASPVVIFDALEPVCLNGGVVQFTGSETGGLLGSYEYTGNGVSTTGLFNPIIAGIGVHAITYTFTASNGCTNSQTQSIEVYPVPTVDAGSDFYILAGGQKQILATAKGNGLTYKWTPSIGLSADDVLNPIANPEQDTRYTLTVTSSHGCYMTDDVYVYVLQNVNAPNSFTPNGDGVNDVWNVKYLDTYPNANVEIYNRNGERVYFSKGYAVPFDGNYKNQPLPVGTYYYIINPNSGRKSITGNLTIIR
ncbi:PKD domain-containing protein [Pedobacter frigiditerrae]|uniref:PKD domain-containing protein n=1 Tax=Pedobacter frigiditerrae TaxID=2530452 RepID=UPI00292F3332|nr:PKD domain-containing protein [Pedobacter frigiditerrae]